jgi:hypothetical protein
MAGQNSLDLDTLLTRDHVALALTEAGFPVRSATLATKASRGGGPIFKLFGTRPLYRWGDALDWAKARLSEPRRRGDLCETANTAEQSADRRQSSTDGERDGARSASRGG